MSNRQPEQVGEEQQAVDRMDRVTYAIREAGQDRGEERIIQGEALYPEGPVSWLGEVEGMVWVTVEYPIGDVVLDRRGDLHVKRRTGKGGQ